MKMSIGTEPYANQRGILLCMCTYAVVMSSVLTEVLASCIVLMVSCIFTVCIEIAKITLHSKYVRYRLICHVTTYVGYFHIRCRHVCTTC